MGWDIVRLTDLIDEIVKGGCLELCLKEEILRQLWKLIRLRNRIQT